MRNKILGAVAEGSAGGASGEEGPGESGPGFAPDSAAGRAVDRALAGRRRAYAQEVERLVEAAFREIGRTGGLEPRVAEIVRAAGLSNQAFYRHFRSKHELLVAVVDRGAELLAGYLAHRMEGVTTPREAVRTWLEGMCAQALRPEAAAATRPFVLARGRLAEAFPEEVARSERRVEALLHAPLAALGCPARDAESLYHLAMGWMQARLLEEGPADADDAERLIAFALAGLARAGEA